MFAGCFPPELREEVYPRIEGMQEVLGLANDSHVASGRLESLRERLRSPYPDDWKRLGPGIDSLLRFHRRRLPRQREAFVQWWKAWQDEDVPRFRGLLQGKAEAEPAPAPVVNVLAEGQAG